MHTLIMFAYQHMQAWDAMYGCYGQHAIFISDTPQPSCPAESCILRHCVSVGVCLYRIIISADISVLPDIQQVLFKPILADMDTMLISSCIPKIIVVKQAKQIVFYLFSEALYLTPCMETYWRSMPTVISLSVSMGSTSSAGKCLQLYFCNIYRTLEFK